MNSMEFRRFLWFSIVRPATEYDMCRIPDNIFDKLCDRLHRCNSVYFRVFEEGALCFMRWLPRSLPRSRSATYLANLRKMICVLSIVLYSRASSHARHQPVYQGACDKQRRGHRFLSSYRRGSGRHVQQHLARLEGKGGHHDCLGPTKKRVACLRAFDLYKAQKVIEASQ